MRLRGKAIDTFLRKPDPAVRAVLLFGPDDGLIRARARQLGKYVVEDLTDPFRVVDMPASGVASDSARLLDEVAAISMLGGRRLVRVLDAGDSLTAAIAPLFENAPGDAFVLVLGGDLAASRSKLVALFEKSDQAAAIACYPDDPGALEDVIDGQLSKAGLGIDPNARAWLAAHLGNDRGVTLSELDKLALYKGSGRISLDDVQAILADGAAFTLDELSLAVMDGDHRQADGLLNLALVAGESPIAILRAVSRRVERLLTAAGGLQDGESMDEALKRVRSPTFFREESRFRSQLRHWGLARLLAAAEILAEAEIQCKSTGSPAETVCARALMRLAAAARGPGR